MYAKLTLKLDKDVIDRAKEYAAKHKRSLSQIIESYLLLLTSEDDYNRDIQISSFVKSMASGVHIPPHLDDKKEYSNHLAKKYRNS